MEESTVRDVYGRALRYGMQLTRNPDDASDLVHTALLRCMEYEENHAIEDFPTFLMRVMRNEFVSLGRRQRVIQFTSIEAMQEQHAGETPRAFGSRDLRIDGYCDTAFLMDCIEGLAPLHREAVRLLCVEELKYEEAAELLGGLSVGTLKSRLSRARKKIAIRWDAASE